MSALSLTGGINQSCPRLKKLGYTPIWKDGEPLTQQSQRGAVFKIISLESYEDALGNLKISSAEKQLPLVSQNSAAFHSYILNYMLEVETRGSQSLLNTD